jgi:hypothetical protein
MKRENKFYQKILTFFISYNNSLIKIYNYYFLINKYKTIFYRYLIKKFDFMNKQGKNK